MIPATISVMNLEAGSIAETASMLDELWPLGDIDPKKSKFPCCLVWTPLPVVSWLAPFIGHVGICREDGSILDFSGSNLVNVDHFAFGAAAKYYQLDRKQVFIKRHFKLWNVVLNRTCPPKVSNDGGGNLFVPSLSRICFRSFDMVACNVVDLSKTHLLSFDL